MQAVALAVAVCFSVGATDSGVRLNDLSHRLMCQCGCAQLLGECDHMGCPSREPEMAELKAAIAAGLSDKEIFAAFSAKYGAVVLAAPTTHGFDLVAWIAPFAVFAAALDDRQERGSGADCRSCNGRAAREDSPRDG